MVVKKISGVVVLSSFCMNSARKCEWGRPVPVRGIGSTGTFVLKGSFTIFLFSVRTHILDSNEVWYS